MKPRFTLLFALMVMIPLAASVWFTSHAVRTARTDAASAAAALRSGRARDVAATIDNRLRVIERTLSDDLDHWHPAGTGDEQNDFRYQQGKSGKAIEPRLNADRFILQRFLIASDGAMTYPDTATQRSRRSDEFINATLPLFEHGLAFGSPANENRQTSTSDAGWHTWFHAEGLQLVYWKRRKSGELVGAWVNRPVLVSELINLLPDTPLENRLDSAPQNDMIINSVRAISRNDYTITDRYSLVNASDTALYTWGGTSAAKAITQTLPLAAPLSSWKITIDYELPDYAANGIWLNNVTLALVAGTSIFLVIAFVFLREHRRNMREARERVSFVNQVSHELKTPLTNIQLYSELAENQLTRDDDHPAIRHVGVIRHEAQRLGRLIHNVLTFARSEKSALTVQSRTVETDQLVDSVVESWSPTFEKKGIVIDRTGTASAAIGDPDAIEQIIGNLFSNVEKYAVDGGWIGIQTSASDEFITITVADRGPGVPRTKQRRIFQPFTRLDNRITAEASGSGLGLNIARTLARRMGGDLTLSSSGSGACFKLTLPSA